MAPRASRIEARTRTAEFDIEGDLWVIDYKPFSQRIVAEAQREGTDAEKLERMIGLLEQVIVSWNLEDDEGNRMPFDAEWLRGVGLDYVGQILQGISASVAVPKSSATPS